MPGEEGHANLRALRGTLRQRNERMRLSLPAADARWRARLRRQSDSDVLVVFALVTQRIECGKHNVKIGIAQRIQQRSTAMIPGGTARPGADRLDADDG